MCDIYDKEDVHLKGYWQVESGYFDSEYQHVDHSAEFMEKEDAEEYLRLKQGKDKLAQLTDLEAVKRGLEEKERWMNNYKCPKCGGKLPK